MATPVYTGALEYYFQGERAFTGEDWVQQQKEYLVINKLGPGWLAMKHLSDLEKAQQANFPSEENVLITGGPYSHFQFQVCSRPLLSTSGIIFGPTGAMPTFHGWQCFCQVLRMNLIATTGLSRIGIDGLQC